MRARLLFGSRSSLSRERGDRLGGGLTRAYCSCEGRSFFSNRRHREGVERVSVAADHDIRSWPRRRDAAKRAGVSESALLRYEGKYVNSVRDGRGHRRYDPQELAKLATRIAREERRGTRKRSTKARTPTAASPAAPSVAAPTEPAEPRVSGVLTRRAFEMFDRNESRARVCMELGEPIENVNWLYENYLVLSEKMTLEAARRFVRGGTPPAATRREEFVARSVDPTELASRRGRLDAADRALLEWIEQSDAQKRVHDEKRQAVLAERAASSPTNDGNAVPLDVDDEEIAARPRDSLTPAERELRDIIDQLKEEEARRRSVRIAG
jgi:hypothetical protein